MNMFAKNDANSVEEYLSNIPDDRKEIVQFIHEFIKKTAPALQPYFATNMIGYGSFNYLDSKNLKKQWPIIALASQKNYLSIYVCSKGDLEAKKQISIAKLGTLTKSLGCVRFKNVSEIDLETLQELLQFAEKNPGLASARMVD